MKLLTRISESEVVAEFLKAEINSKRFGSSIIQALGSRDGRIITDPDLNDAEANTYRKQILGQVRGFGKNERLFENFPAEVAWYKAVFGKTDLDSVMYIDYSYWNELSGGTRLPLEASKNVLADVEIFGVSNDGFKEILSEIRKGRSFPKLIFVSCDESSRIVVLEGHARLTAYYMDPRYIPSPMEVVIGYSESFNRWSLY